MGLFSKKKKECCPICGGELKRFSSTQIKDGAICDKCVAMVRGQFKIGEYAKQKWGTDGWHREDYKIVITDALGGMTVDEIRQMIAEKGKKNEAQIQELGDQFANMARVESFFTIAPKPLEVGLKRAKEMKNRIVATSLIVSGQFSKGDIVIVKTGKTETETKILDVIPCSNSSTFETELAANLRKHNALPGTSAWIILDMTEGISEGTIIGC